MITDAEFEEDKTSKPAIHVIISKIKQLPATIWLANELIKQGLLNIGVEETEKFHTIFNLANEKHMKQVCRAFNDADDEEDFAYEYYLNTFEL
jgi:adenosine deaminase